MEFYESPEAEIEAIRRAAARAGCRVQLLGRQPARLSVASGLSDVMDDGPIATLGTLECGDGWAAARLLLSLAIEDARTPGARALAARLRGMAPDDRAFAEAVHAFVSAVPFQREVGEIFQSGGYTLARNAGDCDDHFRLAYALGVAGGLRGALGILHKGDGPDVPREDRGPAHAVSMFWLDGGWRFAETTVAAAFGENPNTAARRLGLTSDRSDIAKELRIMTEQDLPAVPGGFSGRNSPAQVSLDAQALQLLGYLPPDAKAAQMTDATFTVLRRAVLAFQLAHGLAPDGLLGPHTREILASAVAAADPGFAYQPSIGDLVSGASADITDEFLRAAIAMFDRFRAQGATAAAEDWFAVWNAESRIRNIPNAAGQPYFGLNQMGRSERQTCGFQGSDQEWLAMSLLEQLPFVECFYKSAARMGGGAQVFKDAGQIYVANIAPARNSMDPSAALYRKGVDGDAYEKNKQLDREGKGYISVGDMRVAAQAATGSKRFKEVRARLRAMGQAPSSDPEVAGGLGGGAIAALGFVVLASGLGLAFHQGWL